MSAVDRFKELAGERRFCGWPTVGVPRLTTTIPYFGQILEYQLQTGNGVEDYYSIIRHFGWVVVFGVTTDLNVVTLVQWKPGVNCASWELPPGGIGKVAPNTPLETILRQTQSVYLKETGYGDGTWTHLGRIMIETGKYRGAGQDDHGFPAYMMFATDLEKRADTRQPNPNEILETLEVPLREFNTVIDSGLFAEASALPCALLALRHIEKTGVVIH